MSYFYSQLRVININMIMIFIAESLQNEFKVFYFDKII